MSLNDFSLVTAAIASLSITGLNILDDFPPDVTRMTPVLFPEPLNFITNYTDERETFSTPAEYNVEFDMTYTFCYQPIGTGRTGLDSYNTMADIMTDIRNALRADDTLGKVVTDIKPGGVADFGPVPDPAGNQYLGCRIIFHVIQYVTG